MENSNGDRRQLGGRAGCLPLFCPRYGDVRIQNIAKNAFPGGLILGIIGAFIGFLVGTGRMVLPGLGPGSVDFNSAFLTASLMAGIVGGGLTGIILGVASKLLRSREKAEVITRKIKQAGVLVHRQRWRLSK